MLTNWPVAPPRNWVASVNRPETPEELDALRICVARGRPFGGERWLARTTQRLGLDTTLRPRGRPKKGDAASARRPGKGS